MISVTAAANSFRRISSSSLSQRPSFGAHFKAFGNGRIAVPSSLLDVEEENNTFTSTKHVNKSSMTLIYDYFICIFAILVKSTLSFMKHIFWKNPKFAYQKCATTSLNTDSVFHRMNDKFLLSTFSYVSANDLISAKFACKRFHDLIDSNANSLPKFQVDQVKLHFDEGEFIVYPMDERVVPIRRPMLSIESLLAYLRHVSTLSLFVRGLIPIETVPVLRRLAKLRLQLSQLYFLWCDFDKNAEDFLRNILRANADTITDIGFEICGPANVISDELIRYNLCRLSSLRIWNEHNSDYHRNNLAGRDFESNGIYAITDKTLTRLARLYSNGMSYLELLDLASTECSADGLFELIQCWYKRPPVTNLSISLRNSTIYGNQQDVGDLINKCANSGIPLTEHGVFHFNGFRLSLYIT